MPDKESEAGRAPTDSDQVCPACEARFVLSRTCLAVYVRCPACGATYPLKDKTGMLDESAEEELAFVPLDRI